MVHFEAMLGVHYIHQVDLGHGILYGILYCVNIQVGEH